MGSCREVLTLQLGSTGNYVGAHWWNAQEAAFQYNPSNKSEICHDVLFREGCTIRGEVTFTPRTICVEHATRIPPVPILDDTTDDQSPVLWDVNRVEEIPSLGDEQHPFLRDLDAGKDTHQVEYDFENTVRSWSDLLRTRLHPRGVLTGYTAGNEDLEDRIRSYVEECDNLQGFNVLLDASETFPEVFSFLEDEYTSKTRIVFPILSGFTSERTWRDAATRVIRTFSSYHDAGSTSSLTIPLSCVEEFTLRSESFRVFPYLNYEPGLIYHSSAIISSFMDTTSLAYRMSNQVNSMSDVFASFTQHGWNFAAASVALPFPMMPKATLQEALEARDDETPLWTAITPGVSTDDAWSQSILLRGVKGNGVLQQYLEYLSSTRSSSRTVSVPFSTPSPFPRFFSAHVSSIGSVDETVERVPGLQVASCSVLGGIHACPGVGDMLASLAKEARNIDVRRVPELNLDQDMWENAIDAILSMSKKHSVSMDIL